MTTPAAVLRQQVRKGQQTTTGFTAALLLVACAGLAGCERDTPAPAPTPAPAASTGASENPQAGQEPQPGAETPRFDSYQVDVTLSPAAQERLQEGGETILVDADYYGAPGQAAMDLADDVGRLDLGRAQRELPGAGSANFDGSGFLADRLGMIEGEPQVNINVYSGRKSSPNNLLDCDFFEDALSAASAAPIGLHCALISESSESEAG